MAIPASLAFLATAMVLSPGGASSAVPRAGEPARRQVAVYDTGTAAAEPLPPEAFAKRENWAVLPEAATEAAFKGDAVLLNDRVAVVLRRRATGAEVYALAAGGAAMRARLVPVGEAPTGALASLAVVARDRRSATLEAGFASGNGATVVVRYELRAGDVFVKAEPGPGVTHLRLEAPCRFAVIPDFFADDLVFDATEMPAPEADLPGDNFLLHLLGRGESAVLAVWTAATEDVRVRVAGAGAERTIAASDIPAAGRDFAAEPGATGAADPSRPKMWVAVLEGPDTWHTRTIEKADAGKVVRLDWRMPYPAQWRVDWRCEDGLADSWEIVLETAGGKYVKHGWFGSPQTLPASRKRWTTVLGDFEYPCWADREGQVYLQPLKRVLRFAGPALVYPINRAPETPLDAYTVVDIVRATLGVGPCEYILDVEGQHTAYKGRATCSTRDTLNPIYARKEQKARRAEIERALNEVTVFLAHIRGRIDAYVTFGHEMLAYLEEQKKAHPELAQPLDGLATFARSIDARVAARKDRIKTPADHAALIQKFRTDLLDYEGEDAAAKCQAFTKALVEIGGNQDELVGECRWAAKVLRQRAGMAAALDARMVPVAREIRKRSQAVLRNPASHEAPRH